MIIIVSYFHQINRDYRSNLQPTVVCRTVVILIVHVAVGGDYQVCCGFVV